jgi:amidohydrolase family protein
VRDGGQPPMDAMLAATSIAARSLALDKTIGTIAPGFEADIIATDGKPAPGHHGRAARRLRDERRHGLQERGWRAEVGNETVIGRSVASTTSHTIRAVDRGCATNDFGRCDHYRNDGRLPTLAGTCADRQRKRVTIGRSVFSTGSASTRSTDRS